MTMPAPAMRAAWMADRPMPPAPITQTRLPGSTRAVRNTAPMPVVTPQPMSAARSRGMSLVIFTTAFWWTSISSANPPRRANWSTGVPSARLRRGGASLGREVAAGFWQRLGWPPRHWRHWPQKIDRQQMTWSPGAT